MCPSQGMLKRWNSFSFARFFLIPFFFIIFYFFLLLNSCQKSSSTHYEVTVIPDNEH